jgi:hypothetical protein
VCFEISAAAPDEACRSTITSGRIESRFRAVSTSDSPLVAEEPLELTL